MKFDWSTMAVIFLAVALATLVLRLRTTAQNVSAGNTKTIIKTGNPITDWLREHYPNAI